MKKLLLSLFLISPGVMASQEVVAPVKSVFVQQKRFQKNIECYGRIEPNAKSLHVISMPRAGEIGEIYVFPGQKVKKGDALFDFITSPETISAYEQAKHTLELSKKESDRLTAMEHENMATASAAASAHKNLKDAKSAIAALKNIRADTKMQTVVAPFDGIVQSINATGGDRIAPNSAVMSLLLENETYAVLTIKPSDIPYVSKGVKATIVDLYDPNHKTVSTVDAVAGAINPQTRLVDVFVPLNDPSFMGGMGVKGQIIAWEQDCFAVPKSALIQSDEGYFIYQVKDRKAHRVDVVPVAEKNGDVAIVKKIDPSLKVVSEGCYELEDGMQIKEAVR